MNSINIIDAPYHIDYTSYPKINPLVRKYQIFRDNCLISESLVFILDKDYSYLFSRFINIFKEMKPTEFMDFWDTTLTPDFYGYVAFQKHIRKKYGSASKSDMIREFCNQLKLKFKLEGNPYERSKLYDYFRIHYLEKACLFMKEIYRSKILGALRYIIIRQSILHYLSVFNIPICEEDIGDIFTKYSNLPEVNYIYNKIVKIPDSSFTTISPFRVTIEVTQLHDIGEVIDNIGYIIICKYKEDRLKQIDAEKKTLEIATSVDITNYAGEIEYQYDQLFQ